MRGVTILALAGAALLLWTRKPSIASAAPAIIAETQSQALLEGRAVITTIEAKEAADAIAEAVGVDPTEPAPAQAVYEATGVVPAGHWGLPERRGEDYWRCSYCGWSGGTMTVNGKRYYGFGLQALGIYADSHEATPWEVKTHSEIAHPGMPVEMTPEWY